MKNLFFAFVAAVALASCSSNSEAPVTELAPCDSCAVDSTAVDTTDVDTVVAK